MDQSGVFVDARQKIMVEVTSEIVAGRCPACGSSGAWEEFISGDTVAINHDVGTSDLFSVREGFACDARFHISCCQFCKGKAYTVEVGLIGNPAISEKWADTYFWQNAFYDEAENPFMALVKSGLDDVLSLWKFWRIETAAGVLDRHFIGPFPARESLVGTHGAQSCSGANVWSEATALIDKVWPVLVVLNGSSLPGRFEVEPPPF
jgi:hypothetical protein